MLQHPVNRQQCDPGQLVKSYARCRITARKALSPCDRGKVSLRVDLAPYLHAFQSFALWLLLCSERPNRGDRQE